MLLSYSIYQALMRPYDKFAVRGLVYDVLQSYVFMLCISYCWALHELFSGYWTP